MISKVNWGAIFAGCFIGLAAMVFFSLFALAAGISGVNVIEPLTSTSSLGAALYTIATAAASFVLAGFCTARLAGLRSPGSACLHSLTSFALAGVLVPVLFTRTFMAGVPGFSIAPPPGLFLSPGLAWTLFFAYGIACVAASTGGVWAAANRRRAPVVSGFELETLREESWPAA